MSRLFFAALLAAWMGQAVAADDGKIAQAETATEPTEPGPVNGAPEAVAPAASAVPPAAAASAVPPAMTQPAAAPDNVPVLSKSSIPLEKRQGGDITQCLEAGTKSEKDIAACAEKYRPGKARAR